MEWFPSAERVHNPWVGKPGTLDAIAAICHRTFGGFAGDMAVMRGSRKGIAFHFYVDKRGVIYQTAPGITSRMNHAKGANSWALGIEVESRNNTDPFTGRQTASLGQLVGWINRTCGIPLTYDPGPVRKGKRPGFIAHAAVAESNHGDLWTRAEWDAIVRAIPRTPVRHVVVPNVVGQSAPVAVDMVTRAGLVAHTQRTRHGLVADRVVAQVPPAGHLAEADSPVTVTVDEGPAMNIATYNNQLHVFDVDGGDLWHRWWDGQIGRWQSESVAGPKATGRAMIRTPVRDGQTTACVEYGQLHAFVGRVHAWFSRGVWASEILP
jgi:hypothetical protein